MSKKTIELTTPLFTETVEFRISSYTNNRNLYVGLSSRDDEGFVEPFTDVTVNLGVTLPPFQAYIKNYSENEGILDFLLKNGFGKTIGERQSDYVEHPLFLFEEERLKEFDEAGFDEYLKRVTRR